MEVRSPSFTVVSDGSEKDARQWSFGSSRCARSSRRSGRGSRVATVRPVTILAVRDEESLRALLPGFWEKKGTFHPAGLFVSAPERSWVALRMDVARFPRGRRRLGQPVSRRLPRVRPPRPPPELRLAAGLAERGARRVLGKHDRSKATAFTRGGPCPSTSRRCGSAPYCPWPCSSR